MNVVTAVFLSIGIIFEVILLCMIGDLLLYGDEPNDVYRFLLGISTFLHEIIFLEPFRPIEMNTYRNGDSLVPLSEENSTPNTALLQEISQTVEPIQAQIPQTGVTYAQIQRHNATLQNDNLDFRLQTQRSDNGSIASDYRSVSSGYVNLPPVLARNVSNRPQSPETSF